jgi:uncharacterized SAM-binding protein YcdF (DUF218 family)
MRSLVVAALYVLLLLPALIVPIGRVHARTYLLEIGYRSGRHFAADTLINVALFLPLGWLLRRGLRPYGLAGTRGVVVIGLACAALSLAIETMQYFLAMRYSSIVDVATNTLGGVLGALAEPLAESRGLQSARRPAHTRGASMSAMTMVLRVGGGLCLAVFVAVAFTPLVSHLNGRFELRAVPAPAGAIVVLGGGGVRADGSLTDVSLRRTLYGIDLYQRGLAPLLVLSGPRVEAALRAEGEARAALADRLGVPGSVIIVETTARTTREEAVRLAARLRSRGVGHILLVADAQGMRRAVAVFRRAGLDPVPVPAEDVPSTPRTPTARLALAQRLVIEGLALTYYRVAGYL